MSLPEEPPGPVPGPPGQVPASPGLAPAVPPAEIVEWGARTPGGRFRWASFPLAGWRGRHLPLARPLAGLGAIALFASTIGDWQLTTRGVSNSSGTEGRFLVDESREVVLGVETVGAFGLVWLIGAAGLAICVWLTLFGLPTIRAYARSVGVATAGVLLGLLAAAVVSASTDTTEAIELNLDLVERHRPGWGLFAALASALLLGAAVWLARVPDTPASAPATPAQAGPAAPAPAGPDRVAPSQAGPAAVTGVGDRSGPAFGEPPDLAVGPTAPFARPDDDQYRP